MDFKQFYYDLFFDINKSVTRMYTAKQGDTKARGFYVTILQDSVVVPVTTQTMTFYAEKPDKTRIFVDAVKDGDKFRIDLTNQVFAVPGKVRCELTLRGATGEQISSKTFAMLVDASIQDGSIVSADERGVLDKAFELAVDIIPRLELLDVELLENVNSEVILARGTEPTLGARLDGTDAQLAEIEKYIHFPVTNIAIDGDMAGGGTPWNVSNATKELVNGRLKILASAANGKVTDYLPTIAGHKYYFSAEIEGTTDIYLKCVGETVYNKIDGSPNTISGVVTANSGSTELSVRDSREANWTSFYVDKFMLIDMTELFDEGLNPEDFEDLIGNTWFDGTKNIVTLKSLYDLINTKKIKINDFQGLSQSKNLFNKNGLVFNAHLYPSNGYVVQGPAGSGLNCYTEGYEAIEPSTVYYRNTASAIIFYDNEKTFISGWHSTIPGGNSIGAFTTPPTARYIRVVAIDTDVHKLQVEKGEVGSSYEKYGYYIDNLYTENTLKNDLKSPYTFNDVVDNLEEIEGITVVEDLVTTRTELKLESIDNGLTELIHYFNVSSGNVIMVNLNAKASVIGENLASLRIRYYRNGLLMYGVTPIYCVTSTNQYKGHNFKFPIPEGVDGVEIFLYVDEGNVMNVRNYEISMVTSPDILPHPQGIKFVAHQGVPSYAPLNTMPSFELAKRSGYSGIVTNTGRTSDGYIVALHNSTIDETSNGTGNIYDMTLAEVRQYDFGYKRGTMFTGTEIPLLDDVLKFCAKTGMHPYIRLSGHFINNDNGVYTDMYNMIKKYGLEKKVTFKAFEKSCLTTAFAVAGHNANYFYCVNEFVQEDVEFVKQFQSDRPESAYIECVYYNITQEMVDLCKQNDVGIGAWTINGFMAMYNLVEMGVTEFTTDLLCLDGCMF